MKNSRLNRFIYGVKQGFKLSLLPEPVNKFHNHPLTRIFRVLGGISFILLISKVYISISSSLLLIIFPLAVLQLTYILIISVIKFIYYIYLLKTGKLVVKNSPIDRLATIGLNLVACVKGTCQYGIYGGAALGLGLSIDEILMNNGREPIFRNSLGNKLDNVLNKYGFENPNKDLLNTDLESKNIKYRLNQIVNLNKDLSDMESIERELGTHDSELAKQIKKEIEKNIEQDKLNMAKSKSKILSELSGKHGNGFRKNE